MRHICRTDLVSALSRRRDLKKSMTNSDRMPSANTVRNLVMILPDDGTPKPDEIFEKDRMGSDAVNAIAANPSTSFDLRRRGKLQYAAGELADQTSGVPGPSLRMHQVDVRQEIVDACWRDSVATIGSTGSTRRCSYRRRLVALRHD
jgi:hypothetical protein